MPELARAQFTVDRESAAPAHKRVSHKHGHKHKQEATPHERAAEQARKKKEERIARTRHTWMLGHEGNRPALLYGHPNGKDILLSFSCDPNAGLVRVFAYAIPAKGMKTGDGGRVRLSNGPARLEVAATALPNEKNARAVDLGGITRVSPRLFALFETGETIVVEVPGRTTGIPLKSLGPKKEAFKRACLGGR
jgi:hypothetical protein